MNWTPPSNAVDVLTATRDRLKDHWVKGYYARSPEGDFLGDLPEDAEDKSILSFREASGWGKDDCKVCLVGALRWALVRNPVEFPSDYDLYDQAQAFLQRAVMLRFGSHLVAFNDGTGRTEDEILALCDDAIEMAKVSSS